MLLFALASELAFGPLPASRAPALAAVLAVPAITLDVWAFLVFRQAETEIMPASAANTRFVTHGPYRFSRNPMYLGLILAAFAIAFYGGTLVFFPVPFLLFVLCNALFIPFEEAKMARQFGHRYTEYRAKVRRWL